LLLQSTDQITICNLFCYSELISEQLIKDHLFLIWGKNSPIFYQITQQISLKGRQPHP